MIQIVKWHVQHISVKANKEESPYCSEGGVLHFDATFADLQLCKCCKSFDEWKCEKIVRKTGTFVEKNVSDGEFGDEMQMLQML